MGLQVKFVFGVRKNILKVVIRALDLPLLPTLSLKSELHSYAGAVYINGYIKVTIYSIYTLVIIAYTH